MFRDLVATGRSRHSRCSSSACRARGRSCSPPAASSPSVALAALLERRVSDVGLALAQVARRRRAGCRRLRRTGRAHRLARHRHRLALAFQLGVSPMLGQSEAIGDGRFAIPQVALARLGGADDIELAARRGGRDPGRRGRPPLWPPAPGAARRRRSRVPHEGTRRAGRHPVRRRRAAVQHAVRAAGAGPDLSRTVPDDGHRRDASALVWRWPLHDLIWATDEPFGAYAASLALCVMAGALGMYSGVRRAAAARERELLAEAAAAEERLRIARELHDAVGHDVSLMVVQAQALGATDERIREADGRDRRPRPPHDGRPASHAACAARRRGRRKSTGPGLAELDELVDVARASGLPITVVVDGAPRDLAPLVDQSAFRIVQEAVTNVVSHADRAPATITLRYGDRALELDDRRRRRGQPQQPPRPRPRRDARARRAVRRHARRRPARRAGLRRERGPPVRDEPDPRP